MRMRFRKCLCLMASAAFLLGGCSDGSDGSAGNDGLNGKDASTSVKVADLTPVEWSNLSFDKSSGIIGVPAINSPPVVNFKVTSNGKPIVGLPLANMSFAIAKLVPGTNGAPSQWINYNVITGDAVPAGKYPSVEKDGTLVDNGDGTYQYTFKLDITKVKGLADALVDSGDKRKADLGDLTYVSTLTHRLVVGVSARSPKSADWAYSLKSPYERVIDFIPATGQVVTDTSGRDVISGDSCLECHSGTKRFAAHHATRQDPRYCMVCHNEQIKYGLKEAAVDASGNYDGKSTNIINGFAVGNFTTFIHKIHMGTKLSKTGYNFEDAAVNVPAMNFEKVQYPQDIRNCTKCHKNSANADNWMNAASRSACGSCHDNINFTNGSHKGQTSDSACAYCHNSAAVKAVHTQNLPLTADAAKRTVSVKFNRVDIASDSSVTANFTVTDAGQPVNDMTTFSRFWFTLAQYNAAENAWQSYTCTNLHGDGPEFLDGVPKTIDGIYRAGTFTKVGDGTWEYKFRFGVSGANSAKVLSLKADQSLVYNPTATHRIGVMALKAGNTVGTDATQTWDFVPTAPTVSAMAPRAIVTMTNCDKCHAGKLMHVGYQIEFCATCHVKGATDFYLNGQPNTAGIATESIELSHMIHKIHAGRNLSNVKAGSKYWVVNVDFSGVGYPAGLNNCQSCHEEGTGAPANAANWRTTPTTNACISCHDTALAATHAVQNAGTCLVCHAPGKTVDSQIMHQ